MSVENRTSEKDQPLHEQSIMLRVVSRKNMLEAFKRVVSNKGSRGVDGMTVDELKPYLTTHWTRIKESLLLGNYKPQAVRQVAIPKPNGGTRFLGIPTVLDRLIQQALYQVLNPFFEPQFSDHSFGFRKGRRAQDAVCQARRFQTEGK